MPGYFRCLRNKITTIHRPTHRLTRLLQIYLMTLYHLYILRRAESLVNFSHVQNTVFLETSKGLRTSMKLPKDSRSTDLDSILRTSD